MLLKSSSYRDLPKEIIHRIVKSYRKFIDILAIFIPAQSLSISRRNILILIDIMFPAVTA